MILILCNIEVSESSYAALRSSRCECLESQTALMENTNEPVSTHSIWMENMRKIKYVAAPMVDMSKLPFRMLCRKYGAKLCYTPMFHANLFATDASYRKEMFTTIPEDRPLIVQFCANDSEAFVKAAKYVEDHCDGVDLNLGCPQIIAKRGHYGAFLQDEWDLISKIVENASIALKVPVSCKIRILPGPAENTIKYVQCLEKAGCSLLTVHGRTREQKGHATGLANWDIIREVKKNVSIPVFANGNILSFEDIDRCLDQTGVDGIMTAEGILHNPAFFSGQLPYIWDIADEFLSLCEKYPINVKHIRTHLFRIWQYSLDFHKDLQQRLAEGNTMDQFKQLSVELKERFSSMIAARSSGHDEAMEIEYHQPLYLAHSRPRKPSNNNKNESDSQSTQSSDACCCKKDKSITVPATMSKKALRRQCRYEKVLAAKKEKRKEKKERRKLRIAETKRLLADEEGCEEKNCVVVDSDRLKKKDVKAQITQKLINAQNNAPVVCIDLAYSKNMSLKEQSKLAIQLRRLYGSNKKSSVPFHIYFSGLDEKSVFYEQCCQKNDGFEHYVVDKSSESPLELFKLDKIIQLTPDASDEIEDISKDHVYVLGGIVDETINKELSLSKSKVQGIKCFCLPITKYLTRAEKGTFSKVLSINQVFDILLEFYETKDWTKALLAGVPKRTGFVPKSF